MTETFLFFHPFAASYFSLFFSFHSYFACHIIFNLVCTPPLERFRPQKFSISPCLLFCSTSVHLGFFLYSLHIFCLCVLLFYFLATYVLFILVYCSKMRLLYTFIVMAGQVPRHIHPPIMSCSAPPIPVSAACIFLVLVSISSFPFSFSSYPYILHCSVIISLNPHSTTSYILHPGYVLLFIPALRCSGRPMVSKSTAISIRLLALPCLSRSLLHDHHEPL